MTQYSNGFTFNSYCKVDASNAQVIGDSTFKIMESETFAGTFHIRYFLQNDNAEIAINLIAFVNGLQVNAFNNTFAKIS